MACELSSLLFGKWRHTDAVADLVAAFALLKLLTI